MDIYDLKAQLDAEAAEEAAKAEAARIAAEEAAVEKKRQAYAEQERVARVNTANSQRYIYEGIAAALRAFPNNKPEYIVLTPIDDNGNFKFFYRGVDLRRWINIREEYSSSTYRWSYRKTGKLRLNVGDYGNTKSLPQKKDGSFSYDKAADVLVGIAMRQYREKVAERTRQNNKAIAEQFKNDTGMTYLWAFDASNDSTKPIHFNKQIDKNLTVEEATKLFNVLKELGIVV